MNDPDADEGPTPALDAVLDAGCDPDAAEELALELQYYLFINGPFDVWVTTHICGQASFTTTLETNEGESRSFRVTVTEEDR